MENIYRKGVLGVVVGDALGCPVQFESRAEVARHPVRGMRGYGTFNLPEGSWTDDSSLTLALLFSINKKNDVDLYDIMDNFVEWLDYGKFTPFGYSFDIGHGTMVSIHNYKRYHNPYNCGGADENNNGNGSLMRIMPVCLYCVEKGMDDDHAVTTVHLVGGLTHGHIRAKIACGLYYFMAKAIIKEEGTLVERIQKGLDEGFAYYDSNPNTKHELRKYNRLFDLSKFANLPERDIRSSGYVVDAFEAAVWSAITTNSYEDALLTAVNLGLDTDTVGAICGGLCALYYGIGGEKGIPQEWIDALKRKEWIDEMCETADKRLK